MRTRRGRWALLLGCALAGMVAVPVYPQPEGSDLQLRRALEADFEIHVLRDGVLLRPRDPDATPRSIEVGPDGVYLDGTRVAEDELAARLDQEAASLVRRVAALAPDALRRLGSEAIEPEGVAAGAEEQVEELTAGEEPARDEEAEAAEQTAGEADEDRPARDREREAHAERSSERRVRRDTQVVIASGHTVERDEISEDVLVMGGPLTIHGKVVGDAVALGGPVTIAGEVTGDVSSIGGAVVLEATADVHGDVVAVGGSVRREPGAKVGGEIEEVPFRWRMSGAPWSQRWVDDADYSFDFAPWRHWLRVGWRLFWVLFVALLACIALLVARRPIERMERRIQGETWKAGLVGLLSQVLFLPVLVLVVVVLAISIIGIPVLLLLPFVLVGIALAVFLGFVAAARVVGRWLERRFGRRLGGPYAEALAGLTVIYLFSLVGHLLNVGPMPLRFLGVMALVLGTLIWYAALTVGFGAAVLTRFGTAVSWERESGRVPLPPVPPVPAPEQPADSTLDRPEDWASDSEEEFGGDEHGEGRPFDGEDREP